MFFKILALFVGFVLIEAIVCFFEGNLTSSQISLRNQNGFAFCSHWGMFCDLFLMPWIMAIAISYYSDQWQKGTVVNIGLVAIVITIAAHLAWAKTHPQGDFRGFLVRYPHYVTITGLIHSFYMAITLTIIFLFYFQTVNVASTHAWIVTTLLIVLVDVSAVQPSYFFNRGIDIFACLVTIGGTLVLGIIHFRLLGR